MKKIFVLFCLTLSYNVYALTPTPTVTPTVTPTSVPTRTVTLNTTTGVFNNGALYGCMVTCTAKEYVDNIDRINKFHLLQIPNDDRTGWLIVIYGTQVQITAVRNQWNVINTAKEVKTTQEFGKYAYIKQRVLEYLTEFTE